MSGSYRITTNGMFRTYRNNLMKNYTHLNKSMISVQTQRKFNTYAEDPVSASNAWRLRRSYWRTGDQIDNNNHIISKYESAWAAMHAIVDGNTDHPGLDGILSAVEGLSDTAGVGRVSLGRQLIATSESIVSMMNSKYGDDFIFSGADGANVPFQWDGDTLRYRGVDVSTARTEWKTSDFVDKNGKFLADKYAEASEAYYAQAEIGMDFPKVSDFTDGTTGDFNQEEYDKAMEEYVKAAKAAKPPYNFEDAVKLNDMANESTYVDIGLGMKEDENGNLIRDSAFNSALSGLNFLGYGKDENLAVVMRELGTILSRADPDSGAFASDADDARADELLNALHDAVRDAQDQHVQLDARAKYLKTNLEQLTATKEQLNEQIMETESMDPAEAITEMTWAQYCYNAALRIGTNILSQSLIDYMN